MLQPTQRNAPLLTALGQHPRTEPQPSGKSARPIKKSPPRSNKPPAVAHHVPEPGRRANLLHLLKTYSIGADDLIRCKRAVNHAERFIVPADRRSAQPLENPDLNLMRAKAQQLIKPAAKPGQVLTRQTENQIGVQVRRALPNQPAKIVEGAAMILLAIDPGRHLGIERLDADLKLQRAGWKLADQCV